MATQPIQAHANVCKEAGDKFDVGPVEDASADFYVANTMIEAIERFLNGAREEIAIAFPERDCWGARRIRHEVTAADTLLAELKDKVAVGKAKIDSFVDTTFAERRVAKQAAVMNGESA